MQVVRVREDGSRGYLPVKCLGRESHCEIPLIRGAAVDGEAKRWGWDGNIEAPTITPSYACQTCGLHINVSAGVENPPRQ